MPSGRRQMGHEHEKVESIPEQDREQGLDPIAEHISLEHNPSRRAACSRMD